MRTKLFLITLTSLCMTACSNVEEPLASLENKHKIQIVSRSKRSLEEATIVAQKAISMLGKAQTRAVNRSIDLSNNRYIVSNTTTRNGETDTLMYVFNYTDEQGYAIVSANPETEALIAVTELGTYTEESEKGNTGLALYMDMARSYTAMPLGEPISGGIGDVITENKNEIIYDTITHGPYIEVQWGQYTPYNSTCPLDGDVRCPTGCVATALAQILSYYEFPTKMFDEVSGGYFYPGWADLKKHKNVLSNDTCNSNRHATLARVFRSIGESTFMNYSANGSGTSIDWVVYYLTNLQILVSGPSAFDQDVINDEILADRVVYIRGSNSKGEGHAWVIDGTMDAINTCNDYVRPQGQLNWTLLSSVTSHTYYNHFNWGYDGYSNGYFLSKVFDLSNYGLLDEGVYSTTGDFSNSIKIITNLEMPLLWGEI